MVSDLCKQKIRKYMGYESLRMALSRSDIKDSGTTAHLLLETFVRGNGKLYAQNVVIKKLCAFGGFKSWRDDLIKKGWLEFNYSSAKISNDYSTHLPGKKLIKYINREKFVSKELVTRDQVLPISEAATKNEVANLRKELDDTREKLEIRTTALENTVRKLIDIQDPPVTKEKLNYHLNLIYK